MSRVVTIASVPVIAIPPEIAPPRVRLFAPEVKSIASACTDPSPERPPAISPVFVTVRSDPTIAAPPAPADPMSPALT